MSLYIGSNKVKANLNQSACKINYYKAPSPCLTFSSPNAFSISVDTPGWDGTMEYSLDADTWIAWDGSAISGTSIYVRGTNNTKVTNGNRWQLSGNDIKCTGNIETLLDYATVKAGEHPTMANYCYSRMFENRTSLTQAPDLPATTLASSCYSSMFSGCTSLTQAPDLPATTLASSCYSSMFSGCTGLTQAPDLPATTLTSSCYSNMFSYCTSLTQAPDLPATTLASSCYSSMFSGCTGLTQAPDLPATTLTDSCYSYMFLGCTGLTQAPDLPATTLASSCYNYMFSGCTGLTQAPDLPATTLADWCYGNMFSGCTGLTQAPDLPATTLASGCYGNMFYGCTNLKLSTTQTEEYTQPYRIPTEGAGTTATDALKSMFINTGGTFTGTPEINTTYYLHSSNTIV